MIVQLCFLQKIWQIPHYRRYIDTLLKDLYLSRLHGVFLLGLNFSVLYCITTSNQRILNVYVVITQTSNTSTINGHVKSSRIPTKNAICLPPESSSSSKNFKINTVSTNKSNRYLVRVLKFLLCNLKIHFQPVLSQKSID